MDKLKPVLQQIFWIATGMVVLMAVGGWWVAMGDLGDRIEKDTATLKTAESDSQSGSDAPNSNWTRQASEKNDADEASFSAMENELHKRQIRYRTYPVALASAFDGRPFSSRLDVPTMRRQYVREYEKHLLEQLKVIDPFIVEKNQGLIDVVEEGLHRHDLQRDPTSAEIWSAQEDLWLTRSLLESIAAVNEGSERLSLSPIRQLTALELRGGKEVPAGGESGGAARGNRGGGGGFGFAGGGGGGGFGFAGGGGGGGGMGFGQGAREREKDRPSRAEGKGMNQNEQNPGSQYMSSFGNDLLSEEYGPNPDVPGGLPEAAAAPQKRNSFAGGGGWGGFGGPGRKKKKKKTEETPETEGGVDKKVEKAMDARYVGQESEYRTRAFLLQLKVDRRYVPAVLAELTNSKFPLEIVRVDAKFDANVALSTSSATSGRTRGGGGKNRDDDEPGRGGLLGGGGGPSGLGASLGGRGGPARPRGTGGRSTGGGKDREKGRSMFGGGRGMGGRGMSRRRGSTAGRSLLQQLAGTEVNESLQAKGESHRASALADHRLVDLRIAGLLTIYRSRLENQLAQERTEEEAAAAAAAAGPDDDAAMNPDTGNETPDENNTDEASDDSAVLPQEEDEELQEEPEADAGSASETGS